MGLCPLYSADRQKKDMIIISNSLCHKNFGRSLRKSHSKDQFHMILFLFLVNLKALKYQESISNLLVSRNSNATLKWV